MTIDTTSQQYQNYLSGLANLRTMMSPRFALFAKLPPDKQKLWLRKDPLFRKLLKTSLVIADWATKFQKDTEND